MIEVRLKHDGGWITLQEGNYDREWEIDLVKEAVSCFVSGNGYGDDEEQRLESLGGAVRHKALEERNGNAIVAVWSADWRVAEIFWVERR